MATTPDYNFRYPTNSSNVDVATDLQNLALDVEATLNNDFISTDGGALTGSLTVPFGKNGGIKYGGSGPQVLYGTKSPYHIDNDLSLQNLPVGSLWIQTDWGYEINSSTKSCVVWIKKWPNNSYGNAWNILSGDTEIRNLAPPSYFFGSQTDVNLGSYMDDMTPFVTCTLRRINNVITAEMTSVNFTTTRSGWETIYGYDSSGNNTYGYGYSWRLSGNIMNGVCFQESSSTIKLFRVRNSGAFTLFEIYAPSATALYSATVSFPADPATWPGRIYSTHVQGYIGNSTVNY